MVVSQIRFRVLVRGPRRDEASLLDNSSRDPKFPFLRSNGDGAKSQPANRRSRREMIFMFFLADSICDLGAVSPANHASTHVVH
jgi:hypothetical protein